MKIGKITDYSGEVLWRIDGQGRGNPYQVEHDELHDAIPYVKPLNNAYYATTASFAAVLGRLATYSSEVWKYDDAITLPYRTMPENLTFQTPAPVQPDKDGSYPLRMPA